MTKPIALAADHGGFELKEAVKAHLDELGLEYIDFGTHSTASVDYPDMALPACDAVVSGQCDGFCHWYQSFPFVAHFFASLVLDASASAARRSARSRSAWLRR